MADADAGPDDDAVVVVSPQESVEAIAERYRLLVELSPDAIVVHEAGVIVYSNAAGIRLARVESKEKMIGRYITDFVHPDSIPGMLERLMALTEEGAATAPAEATMLLADGSTKPAEVVSVRTQWEGRPAFQVIMRDISIQKEAEEKLKYQAAHDALTGLLNRAGLLTELDAGRRRSSDDGRVLHYLDLDRFKIVNDSLGHGVGDQVLRAVAERLTCSAGEASTIARIGGDEFVVVSPNDGHDAARTQASRLLSAIGGSPIPAGETQVRMTSSIGSMVEAPGDLRSGEELLRDADIALYYAKQTGRGTARTFTVPMREEFQDRQRLEQSLRVALDPATPHSSIVNEYQLIFDTRTDRPVAAEASLKWFHPDLGQFSHQDLTVLATQFNLDDDLWQHMASTALSDLVKIFSADNPHLEIALELPFDQFRDPGLADRLRALLTEARCSPARMNLKVREIAMTPAQRTEKGTAPLGQLQKLRELGVKVTLSHFGTGYASLAELGSMPFDEIKISPEFVTSYKGSHFTRTILDSLARIAAKRGTRVTADGVETAAQLHQMTELGCERVQGPYLRPRRSAAEVAELLEYASVRDLSRRGRHRRSD